MASAVLLNRSLDALLVTSGTSLRLLPDYLDSVAATIEEVTAARGYVFVEFYILACDKVTEPLFDALDDASRRGVTVRVLFHHLRSRGIPGYRSLVRRLQGPGFECSRPTRSQRPPELLDL